MPTGKPTAASLRRDLLGEALRHTFTKGPGGVMLFLWAVGAGFLTAIASMPLAAGGLTVVLAGLLAVMVRGDLKAPARRAELLRALLARQLGGRPLEPESLRAVVARSREIFVEIATKVDETVAAHGRSDDLERVLGTAAAMLGLQQEAARRLQEYRRVGALLLTGAKDAGSERRQTLEKLLREEQESVEDVHTKLEAVLMQVLQASRGTTDLLQSTHLAEEADGALRYLQAVVDARQETAELIRGAVPQSLRE